MRLLLLAVAFIVAPLASGQAFLCNIPSIDNGLVYLTIRPATPTSQQTIALTVGLIASGTADLSSAGSSPPPPAP